MNDASGSILGEGKGSHTLTTPDGGCDLGRVPKASSFSQASSHFSGGAWGPVALALQLLGGCSKRPRLTGLAGCSARRRLPGTGARVSRGLFHGDCNSKHARLNASASDRRELKTDSTPHFDFYR